MKSCECWEERKAIEDSEAVEWQKWCDDCPLLEGAREEVQKVYQEVMDETL